MNIQTSTITVVTIEKTTDEWRQVLADDTAFKAELRDVLGQIVHASDTRRSNFSISGDVTHPAGSIEKAAKKQKRFLDKRAAARSGVHAGKKTTSGAPTHPCPMAGCERAFYNQKALNIHMGRTHKNTLNAVPAADDESAN